MFCGVGICVCCVGVDELVMWCFGVVECECGFCECVVDYDYVCWCGGCVLCECVVG